MQGVRQSALLPVTRYAAVATRSATVAGEVPVDRGSADAKGLSDRRHRVLPSAIHLPSHLDPVGAHHRRSAAAASTGPSGGQPDVGALVRPGRRPSHGDGGRPRAPNPTPANLSASQAELPWKNYLSGIGPCWVRSRPESRGRQRAGADQDVGCNRRSLHLQLPDLRRGDRRGGVRVSHPVAASPPGSCLRGGESPRTGLTDSRWVTQQVRNLCWCWRSEGDGYASCWGGSGGSGPVARAQPVRRVSILESTGGGVPAGPDPGAGRGELR
jgi:hypothetical protein